MTCRFREGKMITRDQAEKAGHWEMMGDVVKSAEKD